MAYWFRAKRYGWGWSWPLTWQGWIVLLGFFMLVGAGVLVFPPHSNAPALVIYVLVLSALMVAICWLKGEPPRWRWGK